MLDFAPIRAKQTTFSELAGGLTRDDLRALTNEMIDHQLALVAECVDADVTFVPVDPAANDTFAAPGAQVDLAWTLGHVIVHATASSEEAAFLAAELARGVEFHGRSRSEVAWETVTTIAQVRQRLEESRRMRLASLDLWPDQPYLDNKQELSWLGESIAAPARFVLGLSHDDSHLGQIADIVQQARAARGA